jgi:plasmid stabilization system protein ParE
MKVVWSKRARESLANIYEYVYRDNPKSAEKVLKALLEKGNSLSDPRIEYPVDPIINKDRYKFILQWSYKIIYERSREKVLIIDVFHTRQNPREMSF